MATRHGRSRPFARLRCDAPGAAGRPRRRSTVIDYAGGFAGGDELRRAAGRVLTSDDLLLTDGPFQAAGRLGPDRVHVAGLRDVVRVPPGGRARPPGGRVHVRPGGDATHLAAGTAGAGLGYQGITDSVAVKFDLVDNAGEGGHSVGVFTGGAEPTVPAVRLDGTPDPPPRPAPDPGRPRLRRGGPDRHPDRHHPAGPHLDAPVRRGHPGRGRRADRRSSGSRPGPGSCSPARPSTRGRSPRWCPTPRPAGRRRSPPRPRSPGSARPPWPCPSA